MTSWSKLYNEAVSPQVGDLVFAYDRGIHRVLAVVDATYSSRSGHRIVYYERIADRHFNPAPPFKGSCDILYVRDFEKVVRSSGYLNPEEIIAKVKSYL